MRFKQFLESFDLHKHEHFLHHIAEEELVACKVHELRSIDGNTIAIIADCKDEKKRKEGYQDDLTKKLRARLLKHPRLATIQVKVYHKDIVGDEFDTTPEIAS